MTFSPRGGWLKWCGGLFWSGSGDSGWPRWLVIDGLGASLWWCLVLGDVESWGDWDLSEDVLDDLGGSHWENREKGIGKLLDNELAQTSSKTDHNRGTYTMSKLAATLEPDSNTLSKSSLLELQTIVSSNVPDNFSRLVLWQEAGRVLEDGLVHVSPVTSGDNDSIIGLLDNLASAGISSCDNNSLLLATRSEDLLVIQDSVWPLGLVLTDPETLLVLLKVERLNELKTDDTVVGGFVSPDGSKTLLGWEVVKWCNTRGVKDLVDAKIPQISFRLVILGLVF